MVRPDDSGRPPDLCVSLRQLLPGRPLAGIFDLEELRKLALAGFLSG